MIEPSNIANPFGNIVIKDIFPSDTLQIWQVQSNGFYGDADFDNDQGVIDQWNSAFSKAPIQYTDKGKVCD